MKTVPNTYFTAANDELKLVLNLLKGVTACVQRGNNKAAMRDLLECESIIKLWPQSSLAGHMFKRVVECRQLLEGKMR